MKITISKYAFCSCLVLGSFLLLFVQNAPADNNFEININDTSGEDIDRLVTRDSCVKQLSRCSARARRDLTDCVNNQPFEYFACHEEYEAYMGLCIMFYSECRGYY